MNRRVALAASLHLRLPFRASPLQTCLARHIILYHYLYNSAPRGNAQCIHLRGISDCKTNAWFVYEIARDQCLRCRCQSLNQMASIRFLTFHCTILKMNTLSGGSSYAGGKRAARPAALLRGAALRADGLARHAAGPHRRRPLPEKER